MASSCDLEKQLPSRRRSTQIAAPHPGPGTVEPLALRLSSSAVGLGLLRSSCLEIGSLPELGLDHPYRWRHPQGEKVSGPWARPEATGAPAKGSEELETRAGAWDAEERSRAGGGDPLAASPGGSSQHFPWEILSGIILHLPVLS